MPYNVFISNNQWRIWLAGQKGNERRTVKEWCTLEGADLCWNLGVFDMTHGDSYTYVKGPKINLDSSGKTHPTIGGKSRVLTLNAENECKGYSNGIINGMVSVNAPMGGSRTRNGIGITAKGHIIIAQSSHKCTERTFCNNVNEIVKKKNEVVSLFVLQDGGGSTSQYSAKSKLDFNPEPDRKGVLRPVATVVCAKLITAPAMTRPLCRNCHGTDVELLQAVLGGIEIDGDAGPGTEKRIIEAQTALGFSVDLRKGIASAYTFKKMGLAYSF